LKLRLAIALSLFIVPVAFIVAIPALRPFWDDYQTVVRDCVDTKPSQRTATQQRNCKPRGPAGLVIPGLL
jgi:hypothetical protein